MMNLSGSDLTRLYQPKKFKFHHMAELELTEEEQEEKSYLNWDDETLGKFVKKKAIELEDYYGENVTRQEAAVVTLLAEVIESETNMTVMEVEGVTQDGEDLGHWRITFEKVDPDLPGSDGPPFDPPENSPDNDGGVMI